MTDTQWVGLFVTLVGAAWLLGYGQMQRRSRNLRREETRRHLRSINHPTKKEHRP